MKDRLLLTAYLSAVLAATLVHDPRLLGAGLAVVLALAGRDAPRLLGRALRAAAPFALTVSAAFLGTALWRGTPWSGFLLLLNTRVLLLTTLAFLVVERIDLLRAVGRSGTLGYVITLTTSQLLTFRRLYGDFRLALASRTPRRVGTLTALRHGAAAGAWFLRKAEHDAAEITQAMTARGFFHDRD
jgi:cobalt/nickel transport system permease protein